MDSTPSTRTFSPFGTFSRSLEFTPSPELIQSAHAPFASVDTTTPDRTPKRVILRIRPIPGNDTEDNKYQEYIKTFLLHCGPARWDPNTFYSTRHYDHVQPCSATHLWHIVIDMEKDKFDGLDFDQLPHEIYKVERRQTGLHFHLRDPIKYARFYSIVHSYSDGYLWASQPAPPACLLESEMAKCNGW
ncbi:hypothetical protein GP486_008115 [Trichoglossum hirsutum]|uniref:Uncharacterized protein n=1 Tax=Trichoglossum hirsutum TaxID=265104 RepID=A0A9P8IAK6_9PEZI|nr:hypothetical protein GP486_008115 [Trichoglossum hirsutum]